MPQREQFFQDMDGDARQAVLLVAQVGAAPNELQLVTQIAEYDDDAEGLRPIRTYIIRVLGALEHRLNNLGTTTPDVELVTEHPLLYQYTTPPTAVFFRGEPDHVDALTLDIAQAHSSVMQGWRQFPTYLNTGQPLSELFASGGGLVGQMPQPLAEKVVSVLEHHGLETKTTQDTAYIDRHDNPALQTGTLKLLRIGGSFFVSYAFAFDEMTGRRKKSVVDTPDASETS